MGLGNMTVLSDAQGDRIRGRSIAIVSGSATVGSTTESYFLVNSNFAIGGKIVISGGSFAAGGSFAIAH
jgi:hypothetical protein